MDNSKVRRAGGVIRHDIIVGLVCLVPLVVLGLIWPASSGNSAASVLGLIWLPFAVGLVAALLPRWAPWPVLLVGVVLARWWAGWYGALEHPQANAAFFTCVMFLFAGAAVGFAFIKGPVMAVRDPEGAAAELRRIRRSR